MEIILLTIIKHNYHVVIWGGKNYQLQLFTTPEDEKPIAVVHNTRKLLEGLLDNRSYYESNDFEVFSSKYQALKGGE